MMTQENNQNHIILSGKLIGPITFSHSVFGEDFFRAYMEISRLSDYVDTLPVTLPRRLLAQVKENQYYAVTGQLRSYNRYHEKGTSLILTVFVKTIEPSHVCRCQNEIHLTGYLCKPPIYRTTPFNRQICDLLLAVNRMYSKSDYIPCIAWGSSAFFSSGLQVGALIRIQGRMQSRIYEKALEDGRRVEKTAYEVSVQKIECLS